jgi:FkbM family methyltransferase
MNVRMISYAQNAEDVVLARAFSGKSDGFWVDVGANEPTHDSVTRHFYDLGWTGVNIEPQVSCIQRLRAERPRDVNLNVGVGSAAGRLAFFLVPDAPAMSTFSESHAALVTSMGYRTERRDVDVRTLNDVFAEHVGDRVVDFLKVDVEGLEDEVLGTFDFERWRPRAILVESHPDVADWEERLVKSGYRRTLWDGINLFFVRDEDDAELGQKLSQPATIVLDRFDPWLYIEQMDKLRIGNAHLYGDLLANTVARRNEHVSEAEARSACRALGSVLSRRPDVTEAFGTPPNWDVPGLLRWAAGAAKRPDEAYATELAPFGETYLALSGGRPEVTAAVTAVATRIVNKLRRVLAK